MVSSISTEGLKSLSLSAFEADSGSVPQDDVDMGVGNGGEDNGIGGRLFDLVWLRVVTIIVCN